VTRIHHVLEGREDAPVIVLAHALGTDLRLWNFQVPALREYFRVLRFDFRGHGASEVPPGPYGMDDLGGDVLALVERLGIERFHFCGCSLGGQVGLWLGLNAPDRLERLVLANTAARLGSEDYWNARIDAVRTRGMEAVVEGGGVERWLSAGFRVAAPDVTELAREWLLRTPPDGYVATCAALRDFDVREQVDLVTAPALVVTGAFDRAAPPEDGRFLAKRIPGARHAEFPTAHFSNIEAAGEFTSALIEFLLAGER